ncbi:solute carrier family 28 member 3-like [Tachypleus tridentatus]|uniref:solute carrier family 28 member 3-like n=1 Tax=Tachypleus tridentatus TaxID=6853 RepID=UPI003FD20260
MSAPAALAFSKLFYPETEESKTHAKDIKIDKGTERNAIEAATNGASAAIALVANIAANLIAFLAFIRFVDAIFTWIGLLVGWDFLSFEWLLSKAFVPLAFLMGVEWNECEQVARLIGLKTVVNEFIAYKQLGEMTTLSPRSQAIAVYALCGFSNIGSIGIQLGALGAMAPERKSDLASLAVRAVIAGSTACFMTACVAGTLLEEVSYSI